MMGLRNRIRGGSSGIGDGAVYSLNPHSTGSSNFAPIEGLATISHVQPACRLGTESHMFQ